MKKLIFTLLALTSATLNINAQGTVQDYKNAFAIRGKYSNKMAKGSVSVRFPRNASGNSFTYSTFNGDSTVWYEVNIETGDKKQISNPETRRRPEYRGNGGGTHWMVVRD
jgi:hypothetical protein